MAVEKKLLNLRVRSITYEAEGINSYELVDPAGGELPSFSAGSHIDVHTPGNLVRQYSLCNAPSERHRYVIGVLCDENGTGGSKSMHQNVRAGSLITVSAPRNNFPLSENAKRSLLVAGGIGVTPIMAMMERLDAAGTDFVLHFCTRTPQHMPFGDRLKRLIRDGRAVCHHDGGEPSRGLDIFALLKNYEPGTHLYYCGPQGMMLAAKAASAHWPSGTVHCEYFTPPPQPKPATADELGGTDEFRVKLASSGNIFVVPRNKSIVEVLRENGVDVETSCESGACGTCRTRYVEGEPEHNDFVLSDAEQEQFVMICCARSKAPMLILDM
jgi:vanillate O-demethylase ferredoxin subunit